MIATGGARSRIAAPLARGDALVVLNYVPPTPGHPSAPATLLGRSIALPTSTLKLAGRQVSHSLHSRWRWIWSQGTAR